MTLKTQSRIGNTHSQTIVNNLNQCFSSIFITNLISVAFASTAFSSNSLTTEAVFVQPPQQQFGWQHDQEQLNNTRH
jgi:hypothetical protein